MTLPIDGIGIALIGAIFGGLIQARRDKSKRLRDDVWSVVEDELLQAQYGENIDQGNTLTDWTKVDRVAKKELPAPVREEFGRYLELMTSIHEQKGHLNKFRKSSAPQLASKSKLMEMKDKELHMASDHTFIDQTIGYRTSYSVSFEDWLLEYNPIISKLFETKKENDTISSKDIEKAIRSHDPEDEGLRKVTEAWDKVASEGNWGNEIKRMYVFANPQQHLMHLKISRQRKSEIEESAAELDDWMTIMVNTEIYSSYWIIAKKWLRDMLS